MYFAEFWATPGAKDAHLLHNLRVILPIFTKIGRGRKALQNDGWPAVRSKSRTKREPDHLCPCPSIPAVADSTKLKNPTLFWQKCGCAVDFGLEKGSEYWIRFLEWKNTPTWRQKKRRTIFWRRKTGKWTEFWSKIRERTCQKWSKLDKLANWTA